MHSPKPWRIGKKQNRAVLDADGIEIAVLSEKKKPDAALISAAPDLLEACKAALRMDNTIVEYDYHYLLDSKTRSLIESAVAKAEAD